MRIAHQIPLTLEQLKKAESLFFPCPFRGLSDLVEKFPDDCEVSLIVSWGSAIDEKSKITVSGTQLKYEDPEN